jgi:antitoxin (DNA-binding transcriptional repressor) of toxin-antitoxin stability system
MNPVGKMAAVRRKIRENLQLADEGWIAVAESEDDQPPNRRRQSKKTTACIIGLVTVFFLFLFAR